MTHKTLGIALGVILLASLGAAPCSATLMFQAIAGLDSWPAVCAPGLLHYQVDAFGAILQSDKSDQERSWFLDGQGGRCVFLGIGGGATCTESLVVRSSQTALCTADFEVRCNGVTKYAAQTKVFAFDPQGNEAAQDMTACEVADC